MSFTFKPAMQCANTLVASIVRTVAVLPTVLCLAAASTEAAPMVFDEEIGHYKDLSYEALSDEGLRARLGPDLAKRCQGILDERTRAFRAACRTSWNWYAASAAPASRRCSSLVRSTIRS